MDYLKNYNGEKLVKELTTIDRTVSSYCDLLERIESEYLFDVTDPDGYKLSPQEARGVLPLDLKSELIVTGFVSDWIHFFRLRSYIATTGKPHPDIQKLADGLMQEFIDKGYCTYEDITKTEEKVSET
jgi:thymidylate synthase ThyX